jgi:cysteinyl-tRNA synthetase
MMVFQEIVDSVIALSVEEQDNLIELIRQQREEQRGNKFWEGFKKLRATIEQEGISFNEEDFADLRDRSLVMQKSLKQR